MHRAQPSCYIHANTVGSCITRSRYGSKRLLVVLRLVLPLREKSMAGVISVFIFIDVNGLGLLFFACSSVANRAVACGFESVWLVWSGFLFECSCERTGHRVSFVWRPFNRYTYLSVAWVKCARCDRLVASSIKLSVLYRLLGSLILWVNLTRLWAIGAILYWKVKVTKDTNGGSRGERYVKTMSPVKWRMRLRLKDETLQILEFKCFCDSGTAEYVYPARGDHSDSWQLQHWASVSLVSS
jgi:hypothetical protein